MGVNGVNGSSVGDHVVCIRPILFVPVYEFPVLAEFQKIANPPLPPPCALPAVPIGNFSKSRNRSKDALAPSPL